MADFLCFQTVSLDCRPIVAPTAQYAVAAPHCEHFVRARRAPSENDFHHTRIHVHSKEAHITR
ncbi:hypothetical protein AB0D83_18300 [Streptomyces decoyicus]|uniref:hypothetical protein n=1 Tax=Streptomyces decoyicus TaxID=249567 RepID=UPI003408A6EC